MLPRKQVKVMWLQESRQRWWRTHMPMSWSSLTGHTDLFYQAWWCPNSWCNSAPDTPAPVVKPLFLISSAKALDRHIPELTEKVRVLRMETMHTPSVPWSQGQKCPFQYCPRTASNHGVLRYVWTQNRVSKGFLCKFSTLLFVFC